MNDRRQARIETLVWRLSEASTQERDDFWSQASDDDLALRGDVDAWLQVRQDMGSSFLEQPAPVLPGLQSIESSGLAEGQPISPAETELSPGQALGVYRIEGRIGHGGMGTVYRAHRADDTYQQKVAIKVLHSSLVGEDGVRRFRDERQILARLDHPHIARLLDGGTTEHGQPYLVMELIEGQPINRYCDAKGLPIQQRLELFRKVCHAVDHAHRNLVIHRDLKPGNILVTGDGTPKLLDFGIAKLDHPLSVQLTRPGLTPMTPRFASPEQLRGDAVSTVSDVYSLGVILYELVSGLSPYSTPEMSDLGAEQAVCEVDPPPPSQSFGPGRPEGNDGPRNTDAASPRRATRRGGSPAALRRRLAGDVDSIVLTALRKTPDQRYHSAAALADDLKRHLDGMPVNARQDHFGYVAGKLVRRFRGRVALIVLALLPALALTLTLAYQYTIIHRERAKAVQVTDFMVQLFESADPAVQGQPDVTVRDVLDLGAERISTELADQPRVQAFLHLAVGRIYRHLGLYDQATPLLEDAVATHRELESEDGDIAASLLQLAALYRLTGDERAEPVARQSLDLHRRLYGQRSEATVASLEELANAIADQREFTIAQGLIEEALSIRRDLARDDTVELAEGLNAAAVLLARWGDSERAVELQYEALRLAEGGPDRYLLATIRHNLAHILRFRGDLEGAVSMLRLALAERRQLLGPDHPMTAKSMTSLGSFLSANGRLEEAKPLLEEALIYRRQRLGDRHPQIANGLANLANIELQRSQWQDAEALFAESLSILEDSLRPVHPDLAWPLVGLGRALLGQGRAAEAEGHFRRAVSVRRQGLKPEHWLTAEANVELARSLIQQGRVDVAAPILRHALTILGDGQPGTSAKQAAKTLAEQELAALALDT